ncbi:MAG: hypothetical protein ABJE95_18740 [Byssovorax sp.]
MLAALLALAVPPAPLLVVEVVPSPPQATSTKASTIDIPAGARGLAACARSLDLFSNRSTLDASPRRICRGAQRGALAFKQDPIMLRIGRARLPRQVKYPFILGPMSQPPPPGLWGMVSSGKPQSAHSGATRARGGPVTTS